MKNLKSELRAFIHCVYTLYYKHYQKFILSFMRKIILHVEPSRVSQNFPILLYNFLYLMITTFFQLKFKFL